MNEHILELIARVIGWFESTDFGPGHLLAETVQVLATLRQFPREGTPWLGLRATEGMASGSILRRHLVDWAQRGVLGHVHRVLVGLLRGQPHLTRDLIVDSGSMHAKCGGELTSLNPTDRSKRGDQVPRRGQRLWPAGRLRGHGGQNSSRGCFESASGARRSCLVTVKVFEPHYVGVGR